MGRRLQRRYFFRLFFAIISILIVFMTMLVAGMYVSMRQYVARSESRKNELIVSQVHYSLAAVNNALRSLCISIYYSPDAQALMYQQGPDGYGTMERLNRIKILAQREPGLIHSVYLLNASSGEFYSTYRDYIIQDEGCEEVMRSQVPLPVLKPVLRSFRDALTGEEQLVFSYFFYELAGADGVMQSGVVLNVFVDQYLDSLHNLNSGIHDDDKLYLYSTREQCFIGEGEVATLEMAAIRDLFSTESAVPRPEETAVESLSTDEGDYTIAYYFWEDTGWVIAQAQPVLMLHEYFRNISSSLFTMALVVLALAVATYYMVSRKLYSPVRDIVSELPPASGEKVRGDEFAAIRQAFARYREDNAALMQRHQQYTDSSKYFYLRQTIQNSASMGWEKIAQVSREHDFKVDLSKPMRLCLIRVLNFKRLQRSNLLEDATLLKYTIQNISKEILDRYVASEYVEMTNDTVLFVMENQDGLDEDVAAAAEQIRQACRKNLEVDLSFTLGGTVQEPSCLWEGYNQLLNQAQYHLILGTDAFVTQAMVERLERSDDIQRALQAEDNILKNLLFSPAILQIKVQELFGELKRLNYDSIVYVITRMQRKLIKEMESAPRLPEEELPAMLGYSTFENLSLEGIQCIIWEQLLAVLESREGAGAPAKCVASRAKALVSAHYHDGNINAAYLADQLGVSPSTLSRAFRQNMGMTVPEYLNMVRLTHAVEMMKTSDRNITEIMREVGIENESNFYRLFKKTYHMTPREYINSLAEHHTRNKGSDS